MDKQQIIDRIRRINPSISVSFLAAFDDRALRGYLSRISRSLSAAGESQSWTPPTIVYPPNYPRQ